MGAHDKEGRDVILDDLNRHHHERADLVTQRRRVEHEPQPAQRTRKRGDHAVGRKAARGDAELGESHAQRGGLPWVVVTPIGLPN